MQPTLNGAVKQASRKELSGSISSPSATSSGYGSSAEDESTISPYIKLSKQSPFDFPQGIDQFHRKNFEALLEEPKVNFHENEQLDDVFEMKSSEGIGSMFYWQEDMRAKMATLEAPGGVAFESPPSVDLFTEFFNDCSVAGTDVRQTVKPVESQGESFYSSFYSSNPGMEPFDCSSSHERGQHGNNSMVSDLNEIDDMFNFVLDADENLLQEEERCSLEKNFHPFEFLQCNYKSDVQDDFASVKNDVSMNASSNLDASVKDFNEFRIKRKRQNPCERDSPPKSQKQEEFQASETNPISFSDLKFQTILDSIPLKEDLNEFDNLNFPQENKVSVDSQITKDTFLSNFTFQMNDAEKEEASNPSEASADDLKALFLAPLDVGEIFSNLQFPDLQGHSPSEEENKSSSQFTNCARTRPRSSGQQQANCSYFIIAVPSSLNSTGLANCIVVKPISDAKNFALQSPSPVKIEPQSSNGSSNCRGSKDHESIARHEPRVPGRDHPGDRANVLQTILTCGAITFNANQGSDVIYEGIVRGQLTRSTAEINQQSKSDASNLDKRNLAGAHVKSFKADSVRGSNILHRLLKGQLHDIRDVQRRPVPSALTSARHVTR